MPKLNVYLLPELTTAESLSGGTVVVIDILRATTTITYALAAGVKAVIPCLEVGEAQHLAAAQPAGTVLLGGERGGLAIPGFDLGNSPTEYTPERVAGKTLYFTTTNGTKAMQRCRQARRVLMGSFVNLSAVAQAVAGAEQVDLLCAGTRGEITLEDSLCAAALRDRLMAQPVDWELNDQAWLLGCDELISAPSVPKDDESRSLAVAGLLRLSRGGRNLLKIGLESDIHTAAEVDRFDLIPELDLKDWRITI